ncbi:MAG: hypothetical protein PUP92_35500 [Rhizonema sp. PD38]|nr:hypothetical protein [Rhizonema sp. PD38]
MLSQNNTKITEDSKDTSKLFSQLISILVSLYLICIPLGRVKKESKFELVDVGLIMIMLIVNSNIIERVTAIKLGKDGFEATLKEIQDTKKEVKDIKNQNDSDFKAMKSIDFQLSKANPLTNSEQLKENIFKASPIALEYIYQKIKDVRHDIDREIRENKSQRTRIIEDRLEPIIPIFEALTKSEYGKGKHRYHAQLGYVLKDTALKDENHPELDELKAARDSLNEAIRIWQENNTNTLLPPLYCLNWAICDANLSEVSNLSSQQIQLRIQSANTYIHKFHRSDKNFDETKFKIEKKYGIYPLPVL